MRSSKVYTNDQHLRGDRWRRGKIRHLAFDRERLRQSQTTYILLRTQSGESDPIPTPPKAISREGQRQRRARDIDGHAVIAPSYLRDGDTLFAARAFRD